MKERKNKGWHNNKVTTTSLFSLIMLIALALGVNGAWECNSTSPATISGGTELNVTFGGTVNTTNTVAFFIYSSDTANSSTGTLIGNVSNISNRFHVNMTLPIDITTIILEDDDSYTIAPIGYNGSTDADVITCATQTNRIIDRTAPTIPATLQPTSRQTSRSQTIQAVVNGANTTSCRLTFIGSNPGSLTYAMTHTGNNCSQSFSNLASTTFRYTISASDGTNRSAETSEATFYVDIAGSTGAKKYVAITGGGLPTRASTTAQQKAGGQQGADDLDRAIAKAPSEAQAGLTKAKEAVTKQYKGTEAFKTWTGTGVGCVAGFFVVPVIGVIPGCVIGHLAGAVV